MWHHKEMICPFSAIPIWPISGNVLNSTSHHSGRFKGQRQPIWSEITCSIHRSIKPVSLLRIQSTDRAGKQKSVHKDLSGKHMSKASGIFCQNLPVVFTGQLINEHFQSPNWVILQDIASTACIQMGASKFELQI